MSTKRTIVSWSSGKDSAWMLHILRQSSEYEIVGLLTTFNEQADRVAMHGVRRPLVEAQASEIGVPLIPVMLPWPCSNQEYERRMQNALRQFQRGGVTHIAFGDLYLEDIRDYRIQQLAGSGITPLFPIWCGRSGTGALAAQMQSSGLRAVLTCVDSRSIPAQFAGREFDADLLNDLPSTVDPCGESGEFHTFCRSGPDGAWNIDVVLGNVHESDGFVFRDLCVADDDRHRSS